MKIYIYILLVLFGIMLSGCSANNGENIMNSGDDQTGHIYTGGMDISNKIPINYLATSGSKGNLLNKNTINKIFDNKVKYYLDYNKINNYCYQPIISVGKSGEMLFGACLSSVFNSGYDFGFYGPMYEVDSGVNYSTNNIYITGKTFVEMGSFFDILRENNSDLLNQYINTLQANNKYIIYKNVYKLIDSQKYKNGILAIRLYGSEAYDKGVAFKYYLFDDRQYDFSLRGDTLDEIGIIPFQRYSHTMYKDGCYIAYPNKNYDTLVKSEKCYNYIKRQFQSTGGFLKNQIDEMKKAIDSLY